MNIILFDHPEQRLSLLPFTYTRPVALVRVGILTIAEKWPYYLSGTLSFLTEEYLQPKFPLKIEDKNLFINGAVCPTDELAKALLSLLPGQSLMLGELLLGFCAGKKLTDHVIKNKAFEPAQKVAFQDEVTVISEVYDIFHKNALQIKEDFKKVTFNRKSAEVRDKHTILYEPRQIFIEEGGDIKAAILNAESGPIYIGKNAIVQEGAMVRGAFALGESSCITMGCRVRGDTTIGPFCKVGGEISNSVIFGYSNKAHDGYLGNAVLGEWCNLGADTNASNLKNNYAPVKLFSHKTNDYINTGLQFCGLIMGDHSKSGINTMFNTGTVVGVSANVFGEGFPPTFIPSFSWGGSQGFSTFKLEKATEVAARVFERRNMDFNNIERSIFNSIFAQSLKYRTWEK